MSIQNTRLAVVLLFLLASAAHAQGTAADYERAESLRRRTQNKVYKSSVNPNWFAGNTRFWYRNDLARGGREFVLVDAVKGTREPAFDHVKLAASLAKAANQQADAQRLPIDRLVFDDVSTSLQFTAFGKRWSCDLQTWEVKESAKDAGQPESIAPLAVPRPTRSTGMETELTLINSTADEVKVLWIDPEGQRIGYGAIPAGEKKVQHTYAGHVWLLIDKNDRTLAAFETPEGGGTAIVGGAPRTPTGPQAQPQRGGGRGGQQGSRRRAESPDGKWTAFIKESNLYLRERETGEEHQLSRDGKPDDGYTAEVLWSPDSKRLVSLRTKKGDERTVHMVESSPRDQLQPKLQTMSYLKPGDQVAVSKPHLFDPFEKKEIPTSDELFQNPWSIDELRWSPDSSRFTFLFNQRGHQVMRIVALDAQTGQARAVVDEKCPTFFDYNSKKFSQYLDATNEIVWMSERDGWNHLYLYDASTGEVKNQITQGPWVVRGVERVDLDQRQIWFRAGGVYPQQDPYYVHFGRVNFDGTGLVLLTEGDGTHGIKYSPDGEYLIDTYSRVDLPPVTELRRTADGKLIYELERADWSELLAAGWQMPERFTAKGRDGQTDIYGVIYRPTSFDAKQSYAVIEPIYAGPQGSFVPKSFSSYHSAQATAELGFITVQIDGMGTNNRSKAFHDVCWKNLGDAGFPDRILWMKAAASKYPYLDLNRVGIYGGSAGGQNGLGAVLRHPEFYKAAVAGCGCHDNRMDKIWWNELWMSWPVGPHYAESSNVTQAHKLQGKLLLIVGELDKNVDPASSMQVVRSLIDAGKDFEMLVVPGGGHGMGGTYGERRMKDFFVRHLLGVAPPDRNQPRPQQVATAAANDSVPKPVLPDSGKNIELLDLSKLSSAEGELAGIVHRFETDRGSLARTYSVPGSPVRRERLTRFYTHWRTELFQFSASLDDKGRDEYRRLMGIVAHELEQLDAEARSQVEIAPLIPFAQPIIELEETRRRMEGVDAARSANLVDRLAKQVAAIRAQVDTALKTGESLDGLALNKDLTNRTADTVKNLRSMLKTWFGFYNGYDPNFTWWLAEPYKELDQALERYALLLSEAKDVVEVGAASRAAPAAPHAPLGSRGLPEQEPGAASDVPNLRELLAEPQSELTAVLEKYQLEKRRLEGRGSSNRADSATRSQRLKAFANQWLAAIEHLDFDKFGAIGQIDYLLLKNHLVHDLRRAELAASPRDEIPAPRDKSGIPGRPIGREALLSELAFEMIPYTPEELIAISNQEYAWCEAELKKASREMGFGDDWKQAVEKVKNLHVEPGKQPQMIRDLALEAIDYVRMHNLVTVPPLAAETWRMQMMSPERQLVNPFFTGGEVISVSFPTHTMTHEAKLQSLRGNNIPFSRATVQHELIPGHHLQGFMNARYRPDRGGMGTSFWMEGWALYWEMLLWDRGFPRTPEERIGMLFWRTHRCARIVFSLGFHLGQMSPQECIDYLVERVGHERNNAAAEVRRSFATSYGPLYQAAYMLGGLQIRALHRELVESEPSGILTDRVGPASRAGPGAARLAAPTLTDCEFHDAILKENRLPIELVRARLTNQTLTRDFTSRWKFYCTEPASLARPK